MIWPVWPLKLLFLFGTGETQKSKEHSRIQLIVAFILILLFDMVRPYLNNHTWSSGCVLYWLLTDLILEQKNHAKPWEMVRDAKHSMIPSYHWNFQNRSAWRFLLFCFSFIFFCLWFFIRTPHMTDFFFIADFSNIHFSALQQTDWYHYGQWATIWLQHGLWCASSMLNAHML